MERLQPRGRRTAACCASCCLGARSHRGGHRLTRQVEQGERRGEHKATIPVGQGRAARRVSRGAWSAWEHREAARAACGRAGSLAWAGKRKEEEKKEERRREKKKRRKGKGDKGKRGKGEKEKGTPAGFAAAVGHARELRHLAGKRCMRIEEEQRDGMVIGTGVRTVDRRKMISGDWSRTEKIFKRFELNDEKDFEINL